MAPEIVGLIGFVVLLALLALRIPVGLAMVMVSTVGYGTLVRPTAALMKLGADPFGIVSGYTMSVIPLFVLMGLLLSNAKLGRDLYELMAAFVGKIRGGMSMATIGASALFAAVSGSVVASTSTMALVSVPEMKRYEYDDSLAAGSAAVGGTLGILIPPSGILVLYGIITEEPIGKVLIAGILPGIMTALLLMLTAHLIARFRPNLAPLVSAQKRLGKLEALRLSWPVPAIFGISMGGIYGGIFTPTEAGAVGAFLALVFAVATRRLNSRGFLQAVGQTVRVTAAVFLIVIGGKMYGFFVSVTKIPVIVIDWVQEMHLAPIMAIALIFVIYFVLGMVMEEMAILMIMTPITYPVVLSLGFDGVWFGILNVLMMLIGLLTPPVGLVSFITSSVTGIPLGKVFRGVTPFWLTLFVACALVVAFPQIVLFLPNLMK